ncbi:MAG TPA: hypothetical protein ENI78_01610 [Euryarchaeota archaeon]|nr:hypothetical protein [Euryarchaeota archaeon]
MQKLLVEFKNTSGNAPQVPCSVSGALNREETLSVPYKVLANNSSEEDLRSGKSRLDLGVPALNMHKKTIPDTSARNSAWLKYLLVWLGLKIITLIQLLKKVR